MSVSDTLEDPEGILRRWDLSVIKENIRRIWAAMHGRGPEDFDRDDDLRDMAKAFGRMADRMDRIQPSNNGDGEDTNGIKKWIAGVGVVISASAIIGGWALSNQVAGQTVQINNLTNQVREQNDRLTRLERQGDERR